MKERLLTLVLACGALFLFYAFFLPEPVPKDVNLTQPLSDELGPMVISALQRWLEKEHVKVIGELSRTLRQTA